MFAERNKNKFKESPNEILIRCLGKDNFTEWNEWKANLRGAKFISAQVDRRTFIWGCEFDEQTILSGGELSKARIEPRLIEHIKKTIRRVTY